MKDFVVSVRKITDESLMREACEMTFLGNSSQKMLSIYKSEHSPVRTQIFWVTAKNIPLFVATHLHSITTSKKFSTKFKSFSHTARVLISVSFFSSWFFEE